MARRSRGIEFVVAVLIPRLLFVVASILRSGGWLYREAGPAVGEKGLTNVLAGADVA